MSEPDPWEELPYRVDGTIPRWMVDNARREYEMPEMDAEGLVYLWIENMEANAYDIARDEGTLPTPRLGEL